MNVPDIDGVIFVKCDLAGALQHKHMLVAALGIHVVKVMAVIH